MKFCLLGALLIFGAAQAFAQTEAPLVPGTIPPPRSAPPDLNEEPPVISTPAPSEAPIAEPLPLLEAQPTDLSPVEVMDETGRSMSTLAELEVIALANHPAIVAALNGVASARGRALQVGLYPNPSVQAGAIQWGGQETMWAASVAQEIVVARKLYLQRQAENQAVRQAQFELTRVQFEVLRDVRNAFYHAAAVQRRVEALLQLVEIAKKSFDSGQRLRLGGEGTLTDELQLKIQFRRSAAILASAQAQLSAAKSSLAALTGIPTLNIGTLQFDLETPLPDLQYPLVRAGVLAENADVAKAQTEINRRRYQLRRAIVEPYPNPVIQGGYQYFLGGYGNGSQGTNNLPFVMVGFPIPVFNRNQGAIREARAEVSRATSLLSNTENHLSNLAAEALGRLHASEELVAEFEKEILPSARQTVELAQAAYQGGQFSLLQLLQAQRDLVDANLGYVDAQEGRWQAAVDIAQLLQLESFPPTGP